MLVTEISAVTKKKSRILLEDGTELTLYNGEVARYRIREGEDLAEELYRELTGEVLVKRAKHRAMYLLVRQQRTRSELMERLLRDGYPERVAEQALAYVESFHYIDDRRYVEQYLAGPGAGKGQRAVRYALSGKGIDRELIDEILEEREPQEEYQILKKTAFARLGAPRKLEEKEYRRIYGYLGRKGFDGAQICRVLEEFQKCTDENEEYMD